MPDTTRFLTEEVIEKLALEIAENHGAELFAVLTKENGETLYSTVNVLTRGTYSEVPALVSRTKPGDMTVHNHPSGVLQPSQADMQVATLFGEEGVGSMIVNNSVSHCIVIAEPHQESAPVDVDEREVAMMFSNTGVLSQRLKGYEARQGQVDMAIAVAKALNDGEIHAIEAGTGTGKSLAYLVPSLLRTKHNPGRVVIATKTIALQEQLIHKDIPLAQSLFSNPPRASLVKGRNNYICLRKLHDLKSNQMELFVEEETGLKKEIHDLEAWVENSGSGDRADLPFVPSREAWEMVRSEADMCLGAKCPHFQNSPFYQSRRGASQAKILIVNQALLFSDLSLRIASGNYKTAAVIPPYEHIILDEAHSIEDIATDHFGQKISSFGLRLTLGRFLSTSRGNKGIIFRLYRSAKERQQFDLVKILEEDLIVQFQQHQDVVITKLHDLSRSLHEFFNQEQKKSMVIWMREEIINNLKGPRHEGALLLRALHELVLVVRKIKEKTLAQSDDFIERMNGLLIELDARLGRLESTMTALKNFAVKLSENQIPWLELKRGRQFEEFEYKISPLDVTEMLRDALLKPFKSVVMTSATLNLNDDFKFLSNRNGLAKLEERKWSFSIFPSPFDYQKQARLFLSKLSSNPNHHTFIKDLADLILRTALAPLAGGTLVLFTSYQMLHATMRHIEEPLAYHSIDLLVQGRASRSFLVERMKQTQGVLLGTDSFWEGIDLPGNALTKVIIAKLPFRQMGDPIFEARCAAMEAQGESSFRSYSLPLALLKFKQGAGRLIRTQRDRGILIVADTRLTQKSYGKKFLSLIDTYPLWELTPVEMTRYFENVEVD